MNNIYCQRQIEILKIYYNKPDKVKRRVAWMMTEDALLYTDNGCQVLKIPRKEVMIDMDKMFPDQKTDVVKILHDREWEDEEVFPTLQLREIPDQGITVTEFRDRAGRSYWVNRRNLNRHEQPEEYFVHGGGMIRMRNGGVTEECILTVHYNF